MFIGLRHHDLIKQKQIANVEAVEAVGFFGCYFGKCNHNRKTELYIFSPQAISITLQAVTKKGGAMLCWNPEALC